jgi:hypothetical protein
MKRTLRKLSSQGDTTIAEWDTETVTSDRLQEIEQEFHKLTKEGWFAADVTDQRDVLVRDFDPNADLPMPTRVPNPPPIGDTIRVRPRPWFPW